MKTATYDIFIYALKDPFTNEIRYIGKTVNPNKRLNKHINAAKKSTKTHKSAWIKGLLKKGQTPQLEILCLTNDSNWQSIEQELINIYCNSSNLLNKLPGGEGVPKGTIPWNKGLKKTQAANKGSFRKGERRSPKTEIQKGQRLSSSTEFKKGQIPHNCVVVKQYNLTGEFIKEYKSYTEAALSINVTSSAIRLAIHRNKTNQCKGYIWKL